MALPRKRGIAQRVRLFQRGARYIVPKRIVEREDVRGWRNPRRIELIECRNVFEHAVQIADELGLFFGRKRQPRELRDFLYIIFCDRHSGGSVVSGSLRKSKPNQKVNTCITS